MTDPVDTPPFVGEEKQILYPLIAEEGFIGNLCSDLSDQQLIDRLNSALSSGLEYERKKRSYQKKHLLLIPSHRPDLEQILEITRKHGCDDEQALHALGVLEETLRRLSVNTPSEVAEGILKLRSTVQKNERNEDLAQTARKLQREQKELERSHTVHRKAMRKRLQETADTKDQKAETLQSQLDEMRAQLAEANSKLQASESRVQELERVIETSDQSYAQELAARDRKIERLRHAAERLSEDLKSSREQSSQLRTDLTISTRHSRELDSSNQELLVTTQQRVRRITRLADQVHQLGLSREQLQALQQALAFEQANARNWKQLFLSLLEKNERLVFLAVNKRTAPEPSSLLQQELVKLFKQLGATQGQLTELTAQRDRLAAKLEQAQEDRITTLREVAGLQGLLNGTDAERARLAQRNLELEAQALKDRALVAIITTNVAKNQWDMVVQAANQLKETI